MSEADESRVEGVDPVHRTLAADLRSWAAEKGHGDDLVVDRLARALSTGQGLTVWASADFFEILPQSTFAAPAASKPRQVLRGLQGLLVFFPVLVTWWDLRTAVTDYRSLVQSLEEGSETSFLLYWSANGLSGTALKVVAVILAVIVIGVGLMLWGEPDSAQGSEDFDRRALAVRLTEALRPRQKVDLTNVEQSLTTALEGFRDTSEMLRGSTQRMVDVLQSTEALGPQLQNLTNEMRQISEQISSGMIAGISKLNGELGGLTQNIQRMEGVLNAQIDGRIDGVTRSLDATAQLLEQTAKTFEVVINRVYRSAEEIHPELQRFREHLRDAHREATFPYREVGSNPPATGPDRDSLPRGVDEDPRT